MLPKILPTLFINLYLLPHDISGLHYVARGKAVVSSQQDGLFQCHTQSAAVDQRENIRLGKNLHLSASIKGLDEAQIIAFDNAK